MAGFSRTDIDWEDVRFFIGLARHRSLSATARALSVTHATVARRVAALEAALGAPLFERRPDGFQLTSAGQQALETAGAMDEAAQTLRRLTPSKPLSGLLRLTATPTLSETFLIPVVAELAALHPALDIEIIAERRAVSLTRREADIALRLGGAGDGTLVAQQVAAVAFAFYAAPIWRDRLAEGRAPVFVGFDEANAALPEAAWLAGQFPAARFAFRANTQTAQAGAAAAGLGIALLPRFLSDSMQGLVNVLPTTISPTRPLWLLTRGEVRTAGKVRIVRDYLVGCFVRDRAKFEGRQTTTATV